LWCKSVWDGYTDKLQLARQRLHHPRRAYARYPMLYRDSKPNLPPHAHTYANQYANGNSHQKSNAISPSNFDGLNTNRNPYCSDPHRDRIAWQWSNGN
jgi:hypothetical protein